MQKANKLVKILKNPNTLFVATVALGVLASTTGFCADDAMTVDKQLDQVSAMSTKIETVLFGPVVRKVGLVLGMGAGLFQAFMSGSIRPLLIFGGLGLVVCYLPSMINVISLVGSK